MWNAFFFFFRDTVSTLFNESGCRLENALAVKLREYIISGEWDHALHIVDKLTSYSSRRNLLYIREKLFEEKFVDYLMKDKVRQILYEQPSDKTFLLFVVQPLNVLRVNL